MFRLQYYGDARSLAGGHRSDLFHEGEGSQPPASVSYSCSLLTWLTLALSLALASVLFSQFRPGRGAAPQDGGRL